MINKRVKEIRKSLNMTQEAFGARLGIKKNTISQIENGVNNVTEQMARAICREYSINEEWLFHGTGTMTLGTEQFSLDKYVALNGATELELDIVKAYFELEPEIRSHIIEHFKKYINSSETNESKHRSPYDEVPADPREIQVFPDENDKSAG